MTEPASRSTAGRSRLLIVLGTAALVLVLAEWASSRLVNQSVPESPREIKRPDNVTILLKDPAKLPDPASKPGVWLLGNSHTYALPGMKQGDPLRTDAEGILIDELASRVGREHPEVEADFFLLSYPNFLPFEILTRVGHLLYRGHRPKIVFLGLTWRNIARDSKLRHEIHEAYRDPGFTGDFLKMLADPRVHAAPDIADEIRAERRQVERDEELERLRSDSDRIDDVITAWTAERVTLMGKSADLRLRIFRTLTDRVQRMWDDRQGVKYSYDLVEHDFAFNVHCVEATIRLLRENGATILCYYAPERTDLPPLLDPARQNEFIEAFNRQADALGITVLDARPLVPNEYWGWVDESPDRSHFTEPGHQRLAQFLMDQAARRSAWQEAARP